MGGACVDCCPNPRKKFINAVTAGNVAEVEAMLAEDAGLVDVMRHRNSPGTNLHFTVFAQDFEMSRLLLDHGASVTSKDEDGRTVLHVAALCGHLNIVKLLAETAGFQGVLNTTSPNGYSPFYLACWRGHLAVAQFLYAVGADPSIQDQNGVVALDRAIQWSQQPVIDWLNSLPSDRDSSDQSRGQSSAAHTSRSEASPRSNSHESNPDATRVHSESPDRASTAAIRNGLLLNGASTGTSSAFSSRNSSAQSTSPLVPTDASNEV